MENKTSGKKEKEHNKKFRKLLSKKELNVCNKKKYDKDSYNISF